VTRTASPRLEGYAALAAVGLLAALVLRRPELAIVVAPFALVLVAGTRLARDPRVEVACTLDTDRTIEEEEIGAELAVRAETAVDRLECLLVLPEGVELVDSQDAFAIRLRPGEEQALPLRLRCTRWGPYTVGEIEVRARDLLRIVVWQRRVAPSLQLKAYPRAETVRRLLSPLETQVFTGSEVARTRGDGIEFADIRPYVPGDRLRSINWRASARKNDLVVNERHPERNTDVVLFVDSFADLRGETRSTLDDAVRAAATLAARYLDRRDRVGLVGFGGILSWLQPGVGLTQWFRLVETLLETGAQLLPTYTWRDVSLIPARILPPKALILALTPLLDQRFVTAVADLRARGYDVAVVEVDPVRQVDRASSETEALAYRLWLLDREVLRLELQRIGIAVARWEDDVPLAGALEGVRTFRRHARLARV
jgi:uncharacterized protein (DUF58 family)